MDAINISPCVKIWDSKGNLVHDQITYFKYKYSEEDDEVCEIKLESSDQYLADNKAFQEGKMLSVTWGYNNGEMSPVRKVMIFDTKCEYGDIINLTLTCHEKFVIAKMDVAKNKNSKQLKQGVPITLSPKVLENLNIELERGNPDLSKILESNNITVVNNNIQKKTFGDNSDGVSLYNGNTSTFQNLRQHLNKLPGGPYIIESRDDKVIIKTRDLVQASHRTWVYKGGDGTVISFTPETQNRGKASSSGDVDVTNWDPKKKEAYVQNSSGANDGSIKLADGSSIRNWGTIYGPQGFNKDPNPQMPYAPTKGVAQKAYGYKRPRTEGSKLYNLTGKVGSDTKYRKVYKYNDYHKSPNYLITGIGAADRAAARSSSAVFDTVYEYEEDIPAPKDNIVSTESDPAKALAHATNRRKESEMKTNPASANLVGDPSVMSGQVCTFEGVAKKHSGNYYILSCEHTIDEGGYLLNLDQLTRNGVNHNGKSTPKTSVSELTGRKKTWGEIYGPSGFGLNNNPVAPDLAAGQKPYPYIRSAPVSTIGKNYQNTKLEGSHEVNYVKAGKTYKEWKFLQGVDVDTALKNDSVGPDKTTPSKNTKIPTRKP